MKPYAVTRRRFVRTAALAGAPCFLPSHVLGRAGNLAPSDRVAVGFIGLGNRAFRWQNAKLLMSAIGMPVCRIVAVCDVDGQRRDEGKAYVDKTYANSGCAAYRDFREMLERKDIDAVFVVTPHHWHAIMAIMVAESGKDVYCEKPVSQTIREAQALGAAGRRHSRAIMQGGTQARTSALQAYACKLVRDGAIGEVKQVLVGCWGQATYIEVEPEPVPDYLDWELYVGPAPMCPYSSKVRWSRRRQFSGGTITDWGQHFFDVAQWGLGMDKTSPADIFPADGKDHEFVTLRYAKGPEVVLHARDGKALSEGTTFIGSKGKIYTHAWNDDVTFEPFELGARYYRDVNQEQPTQPAKRWNNELSDKHMVNFFDCVRSRKKPNADIQISSRSVILPHLVNIALWTNRRLKFDPEKLQFVNDNDANGLVHIPPRPPWKV